MEIFGVDAGNYKTKIVSSQGLDSFVSSIGEWRDRQTDEQHSSQDMEFEYDGLKGFAGPLALVESEYGGSVYGMTKNHIEAKIRILIAIHRNIKGDEASLVVGQPFKNHKLEKDDIEQSLLGPQVFTLNNVTKHFKITNVKVGVEGGLAFQTAVTNEPTNVIDVGSGTINCIHFLNKRIVDLKSDTLPFGTETSKQTINFENLSQGIFKHMSSKWNKDHLTYVCGASAKTIAPIIKKYYPNTEVMPSKVTVHHDIKISVDPEFSNAGGAFMAAVKMYA